MELMFVVQVVSFSVCVFFGTVCVLGYGSSESDSDLSNTLE